MVKAVIFDMDGLLLDTERLAVDAWCEAAAALSVNLPRDVAVGTIGLDWPSTRQVMLRELDAAAPLDALFGLVQSVYRRKLEEETQPKPGAEELLRTLRAGGIPTALATSTKRENARWRMEKVGLYQYINAFACGDEVERGKPAPDIFLLAARKLGVPADRCAALEDSPAGLKAAKKAGMTTVMVPDLAPHAGDAAACADYVAESLREVLGLPCFSHL